MPAMAPRKISSSTKQEAKKIRRRRRLRRRRSGECRSDRRGCSSSLKNTGPVWSGSNHSVLTPCSLLASSPPSGGPTALFLRRLLASPRATLRLRLVARPLSEHERTDQMVPPAGLTYLHHVHVEVAV